MFFLWDEPLLIPLTRFWETLILEDENRLSGRKLHICAEHGRKAAFFSLAANGKAVNPQ